MATAMIMVMMMAMIWPGFTFVFRLGAVGVWGVVHFWTVFAAVREKVSSGVTPVVSVVAAFRAVPRLACAEVAAAQVGAAPGQSVAGPRVPSVVQVFVEVAESFFMVVDVFEPVADGGVFGLDVDGSVDVCS